MIYVVISSTTLEIKVAFNHYCHISYPFLWSVASCNGSIINCLSLILHNNVLEYDTIVMMNLIKPNLVSHFRLEVISTLVCGSHFLEKHRQKILKCSVKLKFEPIPNKIVLKLWYMGNKCFDEFYFSNQPSVIFITTAT